MAVRTGGYESSSQPGTGCHHQPSSRSEPGKSFILTIHPLPVSDDAQFRFSFSNTLLFPRTPLCSSSGGAVHFQWVKPRRSPSTISVRKAMYSAGHCGKEYVSLPVGYSSRPVLIGTISNSSQRRHSFRRYVARRAPSQWFNGATVHRKYCSPPPEP